MMSAYHPAPGQNSTTVSPGLSPQNASELAGWRQASRARSARLRQAPSTACCSVTGGATFGARGAQAVSAAALAMTPRRDMEISGKAKSNLAPAPRPSQGQGVARRRRPVKAAPRHKVLNAENPRLTHGSEALDVRA